jgi:acyl-CoA thioester hydrolase
MSSPPFIQGEWPGRRTFRITYRDLDVLDHLNHAVYFGFMESLRCDYYLKLLGTHDPKALDIIIAEATCRYVAPVTFDQELLGEVTPATPLGRTSFTLLYRFREPSDSRVYARGRTVVVCYDYAKGEKKEIAPKIREQLSRDAVDPQFAGWR